MSWNLTVAAIVERAGRFLVVEEMDPGYPHPVLNQPAGHVDPGEPLVDAVVRETREETGLAFTPGDPAALVATLHSFAMLGAPGRAAMGQQARSFALLHHDRTRQARQLADFLEPLARRR